MNINQSLKMAAFLLGAIAFISGLSDLGTFGNAGLFSWLSIGGSATLKIAAGLFLMVLAINPKGVSAILKIGKGDNS
jgi:hypothetical protein